MFKKLLLRCKLIANGLYSKPLKESRYVAQVGGTARELSHSRFNCNWLSELGIVPRSIIDLGSYDGGDALRFAERFAPCRVITVEADPTRAELVRQHLAETRIEIENVAVCDNNGPVTWYSSKIDGKVDAQGSIYSHTDDYRQAYSFVEQTTCPDTLDGTRLDALCDRLGIDEVDLLHMDIEGAENAVIRGFGQLRPRAVFLETFDNRFVGSASVAETHELLTSLGYALKADLGTDRLYVHRNQSASRHAA